MRLVGLHYSFDPVSREGSQPYSSITSPNRPPLQADPFLGGYRNFGVHFSAFFI